MKRSARTIQQIAALPYRQEPDGSVRILLITSRGTGRWIIPKGNLIRGLSLHQAAAREAFEEAGISGIPCPASIGSYHYGKTRGDGTVRDAVVDVFPLAVVSQFDDWPEQAERTTRWFTTSEAAAAVDEPELKAIIAAFREPPKVPGITERAVAWARDEGRRKLPMLRWFQALMPSQGRFFELFEAHAETLVAGADALARMLQGEDVAEHVKAVQDHEQKADDITRDVLQDVRRTFVTPFDRSAITSLVGSMDDALDQMNKTAKAVLLFDVKSFEPQMQDIGGIIVEAARITAEAVPLLRSVGTNGARLHALTERIVRIEGHSDEIHDAGLKALFKKHGDAKPMNFIVGQEIYAHLEKVVDCFEDVANEIQGLVIDHA